jgi:hypothetical protein
MKILVFPVIACIIVGCSGERVEEFVFKNLMESDLVERCGDTNPVCVNLVKSQLDSCMEKSNWREILGKEEDKKLMLKFANKFYSCFKNSDGKPLFKA